SRVIEGFARAREPWLVAVRMVSEGVDIPRLRVGVYATTTSTELFFRQAVGRLVRWTRGVPRQRAWLFIPDDARLRTLAGAIVEEGLTRGEVKQRLRDANAAAARELAHRTGLTHAQVNGELNRRAGIHRVAQATLHQLERRLRMADRWMATESR